MTTTVTGRSAPPPPPTAAALTPTFGASLRRGRSWIIIATVLVVGAIVVLVVQGGVRTPGAVLGADNPAPVGSKALVEVLGARGVEVRHVQSLGAALAAAERGATVFLFDESGILGDDRLRDLADAADRLVVAEPAFDALETLAPGVRLAGAATGPLSSVSCDLLAAEQAERLSDGQRLLSVDDAAGEAGWTGCFRDDDFGSAVATNPEGSRGGEITLVAATTVFENGRIDEAGNAALAIGLLGASDELAWYLPGPGDADAGTAPTLAELTPGWVSPVMVLAIAVAIAAGLWRGRRFGPLVVEGLPVNVPAGETSNGRARLYARGAAREHSVDQLRIGASERIAAALRLPRSASIDTVADAAAHATGRDAASVTGLLVGDRPAGDVEVVELATGLERLEREVLASLRPNAPTDPPDPDGPTGRRP